MSLVKLEVCQTLYLLKEELELLRLLLCHWEAGAASHAALKVLPFLSVQLLPKNPLAVGSAHTCVLSERSGRLRVFGSNSHGQCAVPDDVTSDVVKDVAAGLRHTCAVLSDGSLRCFGDNGAGQCEVPADLGPVLAVAAGLEHTCAVRRDGRLVCFGGNGCGQCLAPALDLPVVGLACGHRHSCAVDVSGRLVCFGDNRRGQCEVPADLGPVTAVCAGRDFTFAVKRSGELVCFGRRKRVQTVPYSLGLVESVACGESHTAVRLKPHGALRTFGADADGQCQLPPRLRAAAGGSARQGVAVAAVAAGGGTTCVLADGEVFCFGFNLHGQCDVPPEAAPHDAQRAQTAQREPPAAVPSEVIAEVTHEEPPAQINELEAASIVAEQEASWVQYSADTVGWHEPLPSASAGGSERSSRAFARLVLLQFSRSVAPLEAALANSESLAPLRNQLRQKGHDWRLPSGAKLLVSPEDFASVALQVRFMTLQPCHVLVDEAWAAFVHEACATLPSRLRVAVRRAETYGYVEDAEDPNVVLVKRTFLSVPVTKLLAARSVAQSTTEAHAAAANPRRFLP